MVARLPSSSSTTLLFILFSNSTVLYKIFYILLEYPPLHSSPPTHLHSSPLIFTPLLSLLLSLSTPLPLYSSPLFTPLPFSLLSPLHSLSPSPLFTPLSTPLHLHSSLHSSPSSLLSPFHFSPLLSPLHYSPLSTPLSLHSLSSSLSISLHFSPHSSPFSTTLPWLHIGVSLHTFHGNFFVRSTDLLSLPCVNPDLGYTINISIDESLKELGAVCFQAALLYTSSKGDNKSYTLLVDSVTANWVWMLV